MSCVFLSLLHVGDIFSKKEHVPKTTAEFKTNNVYISHTFVSIKCMAVVQSRVVFSQGP
jgi:hypothetical protein